MGSYLYAELRLFALTYRICEIVYVDRENAPLALTKQKL